MKRIALMMVWAALTAPLFGQEVDLGLGGDASSLLNIAAPRGNAPARGAAPNRGAANAPAVSSERIPGLFFANKPILAFRQRLVIA